MRQVGAVRVHEEDQPPPLVLCKLDAEGNRTDLWAEEGAVDDFDVSEDGEILVCLLLADRLQEIYSLKDGKAEQVTDMNGEALKDLVSCLKPEGRICVITFHSLEDRIVKRCFKALENPCICPPKAPVCTCGRKPAVKVLAGGAVAPSAEETERNPRARSAKLRVAEKLVTGA